MTAPPSSLCELIRAGSGDLAHYLERAHPPDSPLEWLGIAVGQLPDLSARARTADDVHAHSRVQSVAIRLPLLEALLDALATAAAIAEQARTRLLDRYPDCDGGDGDPEEYAFMIEEAQRSAPRHAEMMIGAHTAFLAGAIEAAGALADAEVAIARARRWERDDPERAVQLRSMQLYAALSNVLGGLLAYARLIAADETDLRD